MGNKSESESHEETWTNQDNGNGRIRDMKRDMKRCEDLNPCLDVGSDNAKGYITQRIVIATQ